jgi:hypothetical protein
VHLPRRPAAAGAALAVGWLKPHVVGLALLFTPLSELRAGRRGPAVVVIAVLALVAALSIAVRPAWPGEYLTELVENRRGQTAVSTSLVGLSTLVTGSALAGVVLSLVVLSVSAALLWRRRLGATDVLATAATASLVASPYLGSHDSVLLAPAWALLLGTGTALVTVVAVVLPWALYFSKGWVGNEEGLSGLVPAITLVALALSLRARPRLGAADVCERDAEVVVPQDLRR